VRQVKAVQVTALSQLGNLRPGAAPIRRQVRIEVARKERLVEERRHAERLRIIARERRSGEVRLAARTPVHKVTAPVKMKIVLPSTAPPPRVIRAPKPPPPPQRPRFENRPHPGKP
jgi:hypothetical protein